MKTPIALAALALSALAVATLAATAAEPKAPQRPSDKDLVALGRYLVKTTGCNDCHTAGYAAKGGQVPESEWLQGDALGWRGPWGTTYASNLRLHFAGLTEAQWLVQARTMQARPPMPWFGLRDMSDTDLKALYRYIKAQGAAGQPAPAYLPPNVAPQGPAVQFPK
jgi:mono/diheme cytochrome c family protein